MTLHVGYGDFKNLWVNIDYSSKLLQIIHINWKLNILIQHVNLPTLVSYRTAPACQDESAVIIVNVN